MAIQAQKISKTLVNTGLRRFILDAQFNIVPIRLNRYVTAYQHGTSTRSVVTYERADGTLVKGVYDNRTQAEQARKQIKENTIIVRV